jgi:dephospho-CoA kinase
VLVVGLTGGLGAGKSTVGRALSARGALVIDTDEVARQVLAPGSAGEQAVLAHFGPAVATPAGTLDRRALARLVFSAPPQRLALEAITHPMIGREVAGRVAAAAGTGAEVVVIEIPLLDPARRLQYGVDLVVLVDTAEDLAVDRAVQRGMSEEDVRARMAAQPSDDERRSLADWVVVNASGLEELDAQASQLWQWLGHKMGASS